MKLINNLSTFILLLVFLSCSKDELPESKRNEFVYDGSSYQITGAYWGISNYISRTSSMGTEQIGMICDVYLSSKSLSVTGDHATGDDVNFFYFELYAYPDGDVFVNSKYFFRPQNGAISGNNCLNMGVLKLNQDLPTDLVIYSETQIAGGVADITTAGQTTKMDLDFTLRNGKKVTGYYSGALLKLY